MSEQTSLFREDFFRMKNSETIFYRLYVPENPKGSIMVIHGHAEHSGRYQHVLEYFAARGYAVAAPDIPGFGRSGGTPGDMKSFRGAMEAVGELARFFVVHRKFPKMFLLGHSMGGCMVLSLAGLYPELWKGLVTTGAMIMIPDYVSPALKVVSGILAALLPKLPVQKLDFNKMTQSEDAKEAARQDPLYYKGKIRARTGIQLLKGINLARSVLPSITVPALILHGTADVIMPAAGSEIINAEIGSKDKTLKYFDGLFHELLNEPGKEKILELIGNWIDEHDK
ncbi:MAG: alpha/beta hydrolase [Spirochaetaceae bacterium]|nr:MAG: alpha/beta hydrolase [Spirochaetaceae bacterium]